MLTACSGTPQDTGAPASDVVPSAEVPSASGSACGQAMAQAVEVAVAEGEPADLQEAFEVCGSLEEFRAAAGLHSAALDGADPEEYVREQCAEGSSVADSPLCTSLS